MAISANAVIEIRTGGSDTNGGGYVTGSGTTDYSQQNGKRTGADVTDISVTDGVANGTTTFTSATANFSAQLVGNLVYFAGGTGSIAGTWRQITARASTTSITLDASIAASTGMTVNIGGALASLGQAGAILSTNGQVIHWKSGAYSLTSASNNVSGGCFSRPGVSISIYGYNSTRGDMSDTKPVLTATGAISSFTMVNVGASGGGVQANFELDGGSKTSSRGLNSAGGLAYRVKASNCTNGGIFSSGTGTADTCEATGCSSQPAFSAWSYAYDCIAHDNTITGFGGNGAFYHSCIADTNTGASSDGFTSGSSCRFVNCNAYNNGRDGIRIAAAMSEVRNCLVEGHTAGGAVGINAQGNSNVFLFNNGVYNNTTNVSNAGSNVLTISTVTGTGSFFVNAAGGNFALNNTAGAGAAARAAGVPGVIPNGGTGYLDLGALQAQASGGERFYVGGGF